jgi:hypothetical protein
MQQEEDSRFFYFAASEIKKSRPFGQISRIRLLNSKLQHQFQLCGAFAGRNLTSFSAT